MSNHYYFENKIFHCEVNIHFEKKRNRVNHSKLTDLSNEVNKKKLRKVL